MLNEYKKILLKYLLPCMVYLEKIVRFFSKVLFEIKMKTSGVYDIVLCIFVMAGPAIAKN